MQTAIHFEGDLAYICVSDQGEIKEEEPVTYGRSRVEFVISTAQAQKEGTIRLFLMKRRRRSYNKQKNSVSVQESQKKG